MADGSLTLQLRIRRGFAVIQLSHPLQLCEAYKLPVLDADTCTVEFGSTRQISLRHAKPATGLTWNSSRSSSTQVTNVVAPGVMPATIPVNGSSPATTRAQSVRDHLWTSAMRPLTFGICRMLPSTSRTVNAGPKSANTLAKTPRISALINATPFFRQMASTRLASVNVDDVRTTTCMPVASGFCGDD